MNLFMRLHQYYRKKVFKILRFFKNDDFATRYYLKKYLYIIDTVKKENPNIDNEPQVNSDYVWTMWMGGEVPEVCKICIDSIKKFYPNVIVITEENMYSYIDIPDYVYNKYKYGSLLPSHFSDYIRILLLEKYGGTWIDATCFLVDKIPKYIMKSDLFVLKNFNGNGISSYFIHSKTNNYYMKLMKEFFTEYMKYEKQGISYFFLHIFFTMLYKYDKKAKKLWNNIPVGLNLNTKLMYKVLYKDFDQDVYDWLKQTSFIHKLTYKKHKENDTNEKSLYRHIKKQYEKNLKEKVN